MKTILILACSLFLLPVTAQEKKELTPAEELMKVMRMEDTIIQGGEAGFPLVAQSLSAENLSEAEMQEVKDAFMAYMGKLAVDSELRAKTIEIYNKNFTQQELKDLTAFYRTPLGKKALETLPAITGEVTLLSQKIAQRHIGVFQNALTDILERKAAREKKEDK